MHPAYAGVEGENYSENSSIEAKQSDLDEPHGLCVLHLQPRSLYGFVCERIMQPCGLHWYSWMYKGEDDLTIELLFIS